MIPRSTAKNHGKAESQSKVIQRYPVENLQPRVMPSTPWLKIAAVTPNIPIGSRQDGSVCPRILKNKIQGNNRIAPMINTRLLGRTTGMLSFFQRRMDSQTAAGGTNHP